MGNTHQFRFCVTHSRDHWTRSMRLPMYNFFLTGSTLTARALTN